MGASPRSIWLDVAALGVAIVALVLAAQANAYSRLANEIAESANRIAGEANSAQVDILGQRAENMTIYIFGCTASYGHRNTYEIMRSGSDAFTFANRGGRTASLVEATFIEGDHQYEATGVYDLSLDEPGQERQLALPIDLAAGTGRIWIFRVHDTEMFDTSVEALTNARMPLNMPARQLRDLPPLLRPTKWTFRFSDGTVHTKEYGKGWYHVSPYVTDWEACPS